MPLKYLFIAYYADGTCYTQAPEDVSTVRPGFSAYDDIKHDDLVRFTLVGQEHDYAVDLTDGHFEIDGVPLRLHEEPPIAPLRLIFFRRHRHGFTQEHEELSHSIVYRIGWQSNDPGGKNVQHVMEID